MSSSEEESKKKRGNNVPTYKGNDFNMWVRRLETHMRSENLWMPFEHGAIEGRKLYISNKIKRLNKTDLKLMIKEEIAGELSGSAPRAPTEEELQANPTQEQQVALQNQIQTQFDREYNNALQNRCEMKYNEEIANKEAVYADRWETMCYKAIDKLQHSVNTTYLEKIIQIKDPKEALMILRDCYFKARQQNISNLTEKLSQVKLATHRDMDEYLSKIANIARQLRDLGHQTSEPQLIAKIVKGLTKPYKSFADNLEAQNGLTLMDYEAKLKAYELKLISNGTIKKNDNKDTNKDEKIAALQAKVEALYSMTKKSNPKGQEGKQYKTKKSCHYCQKPGHFARDCRKKKRDQEANQASMQDEEEKMESLHVDTEELSDEEIKIPETYHTCIEGMQETKVDVLSTAVDSQIWIVDSGATQHMTHDRNMLLNPYKIRPVRVRMANGSKQIADTEGTVLLRNKKGKITKIQKVLYVPEIRYNLLSIPQILDNSQKVLVTFEKGRCIVKSRKGKEILSAQKNNGLFQIKHHPKPIVAGLTDVNEGLTRSELWHLRLGHAGYSTLKVMLRDNMVEGLELKEFNKPTSHLCKGCVLGKSVRKCFHKSSTPRATKLGELTHMDLSGKVSVPTFDYQFYFAVFVDDCSNNGATFLLPSKRGKGILEALKQYKARVVASNGKMQVLRCDNGTEYINKEIREWCAENDIVIQTSAPYSPQQNGKAERYIRDLTEKARCLLQAKSMDKKFWGEAILCSQYIKNRLPSTATDRKKTPYEKIWKRKPNLKHMRIFGSRCYAHVTKPNEKKWNPKTIECLMMGYAIGQKAYRLYDIANNCIIINRDVTFEEIPSEGIKEGDKIDEGDVIMEAEHENGEAEGDYTNTNCLHVDWYVPETFDDAMNGEHAREWREAMDKEYNSLMKNNVWEIVPLPKGRKVMKSGWVYAIKFDANGKMERFKARFICKGYSQIYGVDYVEVFAPVVTFTSARFVLVWAAAHGYVIEQMDVDTAFLYGVMDTECYIAQPEGYETKGSKHVCKLLKSLYGTKQGARQWYEYLHEYLISCGFNRSPDDHCVYHKKEGNKITIILIYVDDIIIIGNNQETINEVKNTFKSKFSMKEMGPLRYFVGMEINYNRELRTLEIHQQGYIDKILKENGMLECSSTRLPLDDPGQLILAQENDILLHGEQVTSYRKIIGMVLYLSTCTRPDISYTVSILSRFLKAPMTKHMAAAKRLLRYIKGTKEYSLKYDEKGMLEGWCDASWADDKEDRKSTSGYIITYGGGPIAWKSKKQKSVALSTVEAEYYALAQIGKELIWLKRIMGELGMLDPKEPITVHEDNQGCIKLSKNPVMKERTKHIDISYHFVRDLVNEGALKLEYCETSKMRADILTKAVSGILLLKIAGYLKLVNEESN